jgi:hypothetical protein
MGTGEQIAPSSFALKDRMDVGPVPESVRAFFSRTTLSVRILFLYPGSFFFIFRLQVFRRCAFLSFYGKGRIMIENTDVAGWVQSNLNGEIIRTFDSMAAFENAISEQCEEARRIALERIVQEAAADILCMTGSIHDPSGGPAAGRAGPEVARSR